MASSLSVRFTPLSGGHAEEPPCYLLGTCVRPALRFAWPCALTSDAAEVGGVKILLDCGWTEPYNVDQLKVMACVCAAVGFACRRAHVPARVQPLARVAKEIDFVLITHSDMLHLGGLPYAVATLGLSCPIYVTSCAAPPPARRAVAH